MDYQKKYNQLKEIFLKSQVDERDRGKLGSSVTERLSELVFVYEDRVLGQDATAVIMTLIFDFIRLVDVRGNIELSKYYAPGNGLYDDQRRVICEDCSIVLCYTDTDVCWANGKIVDPGTIDCTISRGLIRLHIKTRVSDETYKYTPVHVSRLTVEDTLTKYENKPYGNVEEIDRISRANNVANMRVQTQTMHNVAMSGGFSTGTKRDVEKSVYNANKISDRAKQGSIDSQLPLSTNYRVGSTVPTQRAVDTAQVVSSHVRASPHGKDMLSFLVPGDHNLPLYEQPASHTSQVVGSLTNQGIVVKGGAGTNTVNSKIASRRVSLLVDSNVAVVPKAEAAKSINISDLTNDTMSKIGEYWKNFWESAKKELIKTKDTIKNTQVAVPVSDDLAVVTTTPDRVPKPLNHMTLTQPPATSASVTDILTKQGKDFVNAIKSADPQDILNSGRDAIKHLDLSGVLNNNNFTKLSESANRLI